MSLVNRIRIASVGAVSALPIAAMANTTGVDVSSATAMVSGSGVTAITAVGGALLGLAALSVVFKWAKAAFFS